MRIEHEPVLAQLGARNLFRVFVFAQATCGLLKSAYRLRRQRHRASGTRNSFRESRLKSANVSFSFRCMPKPPSPTPSPGESQPPSNPGLRKLIEAKREFNYTLDDADRALGFRGWHERGYLPHFDAPNVTQLVTINLADAFPVTRRAEWEIFLRLPDKSESRRQLEAWLDRGCGECWLRRVDMATLVEEELLVGHRRTYALQAWVLMPNHVHLVVDVWQTPLSKLVKQWKGATAVTANRALGRRGQFWQEDYWDTLIKNAMHLAQAIRYVENNPTKARLVCDAKQWRWSSARRKDEYGRLAE